MPDLTEAQRRLNKALWAVSAYTYGRPLGSSLFQTERLKELQTMSLADALRELVEDHDEHDWMRRARALRRLVRWGWANSEFLEKAFAASRPPALARQVADRVRELALVVGIPDLDGLHGEPPEQAAEELDARLRLIANVPMIPQASGLGHP